MVTDLIAARRVTPMGLMRVAIIAAVLLLSAYLAPRASTTYLVALVGFGAFLVLARKPVLGLLALPVAALVIPFAIGTGTETAVHLAVILIPVLFVIWILNLFRRGILGVVPSRTNLPLLLFAVSAVFSFMTGNFPWNYFAQRASLPAQVGGLALFLFSAAVFLLVGNLVQDSRWLKWMVGLFLALSAVYMIIRSVPALGRLSALYANGSTGSIFWVWVVALAGGQVLFNRSLPRPLRLALLTLISLTLYVGWFLSRAWVSGWLPPLVTLLVLIWFFSPRLGLALTLVGAAVVLWRDPELLIGLVTLKQYSIDTRIAALQIMLTNIIPISPVFGLGPANYYFYTPLFPILGYSVSFNSHNQYLDILAQTGIIGMVVFLWLMVAIGRTGWDLRSKVGDGFNRGYVYGCLAGLVGSLYAGVHGDWFLPFVYNVGLAGFRASLLGWLFLGGLLAIEHLVNRPRHPENAV